MKRLFDLCLGLSAAVILLLPVAVVALSARSGLICSHQPASVMTIEPGVTYLSSVLPGSLGATVISQCLQPNGSVLLLLFNLSGEQLH